MIQIKRESDWSYETSNGKSKSVGELLTFSKGSGIISLNSPYGIPWHFSYDSVGVGVGVGPPVQVTFSRNSFKSGGSLYITTAFSGADLTADDITGFCTVRDITGIVPGTSAGGSVTAMFLGINAKDLASELGMESFDISGIGFLVNKLLELSGREFPSVLQETAKAMLLMGGVVVGSPGAGFTNSVGYLDGPRAIVSGILKGMETASR